MKAAIKAVTNYLTVECGFSASRAEKMAKAACHPTFKIGQSNVLFQLKLEAVDDWTIVCIDGEPGSVTFGALKSKVDSLN